MQIEMVSPDDADALFIQIANILGEEIDQYDYESDTLRHIHASCDNIHDENVGYAIRDLNGDGISEMIILTQEYEIRAIYSQVDGCPVLVDAFFTKYNCVLDIRGTMYVDIIGGASDSSCAVYTISPYTAKPELKLVVGIESHREDGTQFSTTRNYYIHNGIKTIIDDDVARAMSGILPSEYPDNSTRYIGLNVIPLNGAYPWIISEADGYKWIIRAYWAYTRDVNTNREDRADTLAESLTAILNGDMGGDVDVEKDVYGILSSCRDLYDDNLAYALRDLNDDGITELIILTDNYSIRAIYSMRDDKPVLVDGFFARYRCVLDTNGMLYVHGSDGASESYSASCVIEPDTLSLEFILAVGSENAYHYTSGFEGIEYIRHYCIKSGKTIEIGPDEAYALWAIFPDEYPNNPTQYVGLDLIPLY